MADYTDIQTKIEEIEESIEDLKKLVLREYESTARKHRNLDQHLDGLRNALNKAFYWMSEAEARNQLCSDRFEEIIREESMR